jgi:proline iminopeptidase
VTRETDQWVGAAHRRLFVDVRGDSEAPALLYLHGGPGMSCHDFMLWQGDRLSAHLRLVGLDQRGVLRSDELRPDETLTERDLVDDCELVRQALGIQRWVVLGHSFGGRIALRYAISHPDRVAAVIFENPAWDVRETERMRLPAAAEIFAELGDADAAAACREMASGPLSDAAASFELVGRLFESGRYNDLYARQAWARERLDSMAADDPYPTELRHRAARHQAGLLPDLMTPTVPLLAELRTPALLITGAYDLVTGPGQIAGFRTAVSSGTVETFPESGHFAQLEEPERYADLVVGFTTLNLCD